ncbi:hypothetical protein V6N11_017835 [Hibiscus sabdariffa]|uniref:Uncharacterized protein n=1 Tax=Hibiscus sabdariffa TaxID=183260 RepID=A0ABR2T5Z1_9ROSI
MIATMNSTHTVVFVSENADPDVINVVVIEGLSLSRRPEPPDRSVFIATLQPIATSVKTLVVSNGSWIPFHMARGGVPFSHIFFADGLILYARADIGQAETISAIL